jgi:hypothetical protein
MNYSTGQITLPPEAAIPDGWAVLLPDNASAPPWRRGAGVWIAACYRTKESADHYAECMKQGAYVVPAYFGLPIR